MTKILLIEDDKSIAAMIADGLEEHHFQVDVAHDGTSGFELARAGSYGAILLDIMLPGMDGWQVCAALRSRRINTPILMLTARDAVRDRVRGLESGADDYLPKPFDFTELRARVQALLRRDKVHKSRLIQIADMEIDTVLRRVFLSGREVLLSPREYELLEFLSLREGRTLTRDVIIQSLWNNDDVVSNVIDVRVGALRRKIDAERAVKLIHTVHGVGYSLRRPYEEMP